MVAAIGATSVGPVIFSTLMIVGLCVWDFVDAIRIFIGAEKDGNGNPLV